MANGSIRMSKWRKFDGLLYVFSQHHATKRSAQTHAKNVRARGRLARVVKARLFGWNVYTV